MGKLLDLSTIEPERPVVAVDGEPYEMAVPDDYGLIELAKLQRWQNIVRDVVARNQEHEPARRMCRPWRPPWTASRPWCCPGCRLRSGPSYATTRRWPLSRLFAARQRRGEGSAEESAPEPDWGTLIPRLHTFYGGGDWLHLPVRWLRQYVAMQPLLEAEASLRRVAELQAAHPLIDQDDRQAIVRPWQAIVRGALPPPRPPSKAEFMARMKGLGFEIVE